MNQPRLSAVILDMDGLLLDTETVSRRSTQRAARELGFEIPDDLHRELIGSNEKRVRQILHDALGEAFPFEEIRERKLRFDREEFEVHGVQRKDGVVELLDLLRDRGVPFGVGTSTRRPEALERLEAAGLRERMAVVVGGDEVVRGKPEPDLFLRVADQLGADPAGCVVLEDSLTGIRAAHAARMMPIMIPDLVPPTEEIETLVHGIFPTLREAHSYLEEWIR